MGQKCCTIWNGESCDGNFGSSKKKVRESVSVIRFSKDTIGEKRWIQSLPNILTTDTTKNIGVCVKHWPEGYPTVSGKGKLRPAVPSSLFGVPKTFLPQTEVKTHGRNVRKKKVNSDARNNNVDKTAVKCDIDTIQSCDAFVEFCKTLPPRIQGEPSNQVKLFKLDESVPPKVAYSIIVDGAFHVIVFRGTCQIKVKDLIPTFSHVFNKYSQLNGIVKKLEECIRPKSEIEYASNFIKVCRNRNYLGKMVTSYKLSLSYATN